MYIYICIYNIYIIYIYIIYIYTCMIINVSHDIALYISYSSSAAMSEKGLSPMPVDYHNMSHSIRKFGLNYSPFLDRPRCIQVLAIDHVSCCLIGGSAIDVDRTL